MTNMRRRVCGMLGADHGAGWLHGRSRVHPGTAAAGWGCCGVSAQETIKREN